MIFFFFSSTRQQRKAKSPSCITGETPHYWLIEPAWERQRKDRWNSHCSLCKVPRFHPSKTRNRELVNKVRLLVILMNLIDSKLQISYSNDDIFDCLCYFQSSSIEKVSQICNQAGRPSGFLFNFMRKLSHLGHINIELEPLTLKLKVLR